MDSIWGDDENPEADELSERIENFPLEEEVNSLLVLAYVDHEAGLSFNAVAACLLEGNNLTVYPREDNFEVGLNIRLDAVKDFEFEYLDNLKIKADFDLDEYKSHAKDVAIFFNDDPNLFSLRVALILDEFRNDEYPDDILVFFFKEGFSAEGMWVRCDDFNDEHYFFGTLLNQPNQDLGVNKGDRVKFILLRNDDEFLCCCNLDE